MYRIVRIDDNWEQLIDPNGKILAESHCLDAEEILTGLGLEFKSEEIWNIDDDVDECGFDPFVGEYTYDV